MLTSQDFAGQKQTCYHLLMMEAEAENNTNTGTLPEENWRTWAWEMLECCYYDACNYNPTSSTPLPDDCSTTTSCESAKRRKRYAVENREPKTYPADHSHISDRWLTVRFSLTRSTIS